jgi:hypothetical protein
MPAMTNHLMIGIATCAGLAACGGGGDGLSNGEAYLGTYQVTSHRRNTPSGADTIACDDAGAETTGEEQYIRFIEDAFFEDPNYLEMETCATSPTDCTFTLMSFEARGDHLMKQNFNTQIGGGAPCQLHASEDYATLAGGVIHVEHREWYGSTDDSEADCGLDKAEALIGTPDCEMVEFWDATLQ